MSLFIFNDINNNAMHTTVKNTLIHCKNTRKKLQQVLKFLLVNLGNYQLQVPLSSGTLSLNVQYWGNCGTGHGFKPLHWLLLQSKHSDDQYQLTQGWNNTVKEKKKRVFSVPMYTVYILVIIFFHGEIAQLPEMILQ